MKDQQRTQYLGDEDKSGKDQAPAATTMSSIAAAEAVLAMEGLAGDLEPESDRAPENDNVQSDPEELTTPLDSAESLAALFADFFDKETLETHAAPQASDAGGSRVYSDALDLTPFTDLSPVGSSVQSVSTWNPSCSCPSETTRLQKAFFQCIKLLRSR